MNAPLNRLRKLLPTLALAASVAALVAAQERAATSGIPAPTSDAPPVVLTVTVRDGRGRSVTGLGRDAFTVYENKVAQEITSVAAEDAPVSVGFVFDVSDSMTAASGALLTEATRAVGDFLRGSNTANEYFVMGFGREPRLFADWTRDASRVVAGLNQLPTLQKEAKGTALYDALYEAVEKASKGPHRKRALVLVSDGHDFTSRRGYSDLKRLVKERDVLIYTLGIETNADSTEGLDRLFELSRATGGWGFGAQTFHPSRSRELAAEVAKVRPAFESFAHELRHQYAIEYKPSTPATKGEWRRVEVRVKWPGESKKTYPVRAREGYFSTPAAP